MPGLLLCALPSPEASTGGGSCKDLDLIRRSCYAPSHEGYLPPVSGVLVTLRHMKAICPQCGCGGGKHNRHCPVSYGGQAPEATEAPPLRRVTPKRRSPAPTVTERHKDSRPFDWGDMLPCPCGCGEMVKVRPVYARPACRMRAMRNRNKANPSHPPPSPRHRSRARVAAAPALSASGRRRRPPRLSHRP